MSQPPISPILRAWYKWKMLRLPWRRQFLVGFDLSGNTYWEFLDRGSRLHSPNPSRHPQTTTQAVRWRRIVRYPSGTHHSAVVVPPAWHQWLRHTRPAPPTLTEQRAEVARQERIRRLAAEADARWEAKPKVMEDIDAKKQKARLLGVREPPFETDRPVGPGSKIKASAEAAAERAKAGETAGTGTVAGDGALRNSGAVNQREETLKKMKREAAEAAGKRGDATRPKAEEGKGPDPWRQQARGGPSETWQPKAWEPTPREKI
ncbi:hypothetical protein C7999DRAFT_29588 [Corynascus novoguineensis]|uniref:NADH dehydrogenase [ubiquinone] 1 alpha subcomplex subunit n=1 Tax=Corynascus novoguineensis TaxID=1126955 RepID=A0AAN7CZF2_9PEZI|nr:hypothetical protein C7999DRAFT_29588 [Corynascus novoguineensis]